MTPDNEQRMVADISEHTAEHTPDYDPVEYALLSLRKAQELGLPKGEPNSYGATPLDRAATLAQQLDLVITLQKYTLTIPGDVPLDVADYVHRTFAERFHGRAEANEENYTTALYDKELYADQPEILEAFHNAELGTASPTEILVTRQLRGIRSAELGCLTHPYGERIEMLEEMRQVVQAHVEASGGEYFKEPETRYRVKEMVWEEVNGIRQLRGLLMTRKRKLGVAADGTVIKERSSFLLRADELSFLNQGDVAKILSVNPSDRDWQDKVVEAAELDAIVAQLLESNAHSYAIPIATTIYAHNIETAQLIAKRDTDESARRRQEFTEQWPTLAAAAWGEEPEASEEELEVASPEAHS